MAVNEANNELGMIDGASLTTLLNESESTPGIYPVVEELVKRLKGCYTFNLEMTFKPDACGSLANLLGKMARHIDESDKRRIETLKILRDIREGLSGV